MVQSMVAVSATFESLGKVVAFLDDSFRIVDASPAVRGLFGRPDVEERDIAQFLDADKLMESLRSGRRYEHLCSLRDGRVIGVHAAALVERAFDSRARYVVCLDLDDGQQTGAPPPEADRILRALEANRWRRSEAARALGISRATLWRRMREFGIL